MSLPDIHSQGDDRGIPVMVGFSGVKAPLLLKNRDGEHVPYDASLTVTVRLDEDSKGTHLSRIARAVETRPHKAGEGILKQLVLDVAKALGSQHVVAAYSFDYRVPDDRSPITDNLFPAYYRSVLQAALTGTMVFQYMHVTVPVMSVCPCSLALNDNRAAHVQRCEVTAEVQIAQGNHVWIEDVIAALRTSGSSPVYGIVKRPDEKQIVADAFANPKFAEDVVRDAVTALKDIDGIISGTVHVDSQESIHPFNVVASAIIA